VSAEYNHELIVTIVKKGRSDRVIKATKEAGAEGGTIVFGRGTGIHEQKTLLGIPVDPEKEIILTLVQGKETDKVLEAIIKAGELEKPGTGISFVIEVKKVAGIVHLLQQMESKD